MFFELKKNIWFFTTFISYWKVAKFPSNLIGDVSITMDGQLYMSFEGIRYAQPAIDDLRFKDPVPINEMVYLKKRVECLERDPSTSELVGEEDCLVLNVYTPVQFEHRVFPVLVWIHGTPFRAGSSQQGRYGPQRLIDQNLVVVTMSYRLGPLGFASLGHKELSGNFGLKDQQLAIKWVLKNIDRFGGDAAMVTLGGEGLGAAFVQYHMSGEISRNISRAITIGGSWLAPWAFSTTARVKKETERLANLLDCSTCNGTVTISEPIRVLHNVRSKEGVVHGTVEQSAYRTGLVSCEQATASCMRSLDPKLIVKKAYDMPQILPWDKVILPFLPTVDGDVLTNDPWIKRNSVHKYSLLMGLTKSEGSIIKSIGVIQDWNEQALKSAFDTFINGGVVRGRRFPKDTPGLQDKVATLYQGEDVKDQLADLVTDSWFMFPAMIDAMYNRGRVEVFMFAFDNQNSQMGCTLPRQTNQQSHGDQMPFMFLIEKCSFFKPNELYARNFSAMIANFVYQRDPGLKPYWEDKNLFTIRNAIYKPSFFQGIDDKLSRRLEHWKALNLL
ncbi:cholinesterase-like isoform X1 [Cimex lectularius]|uniref:Carboxylesterase type B domain-containing protein n=1 Tax=Cimex lectularius TaxID=79782 RepID=A0A8I6S702_CIMLE|nr:cholinesterase-like isoform X1 [Cimex lectularius]